MFDVFTAPLCCPRCGAQAPQARVQTYIRGGADTSSLHVGFEFEPLDLEPASILNAGYALVNEPGSAGPIRLLDVWVCPNCDTDQWAMVEIADGKLRSIEAVTLNRATLASANFISEVHADLLADSLRDGEQATRETSVEVLRRKLS